MLQPAHLSTPEELKQNFVLLESTYMHAGMSAFSER